MFGKKHKDKKDGELSQEIRSEEQEPASAQAPTVPESSPAAEAEKVTSEFEELKQKLSESEGRNKELEDRLLRLAAEFDNYKKRTLKEFENVVRNANENLILDLINILNNFSRALESPENSKDLQSFRTGIELIYGQLKSLLSKEGLEEIPAIGEKFDPTLHEAVMQMESEKEEGTILQEVSKGYKLNSKVIRHSQVVVAKSRAEDEPEENQISQEGKGE